MHDAGVVGDSPIHRLDPRAKLLGLSAVTVIAVSTTRVARPRGVRRRAARSWRPSRTSARARSSAALGSSRSRCCSSPRSRPRSPPKALIGTFSAVLLGATTSFPDVLHALERLKAPRLLVLIAAFMYRYLFTIVDEVQRMRAALAARGYRPRHALQVAALGRVATALFLRTYERGERVHLAMLARGFNERMPRLHALAFTPRRRAVRRRARPVLAVRLVA